jgi:hypothetical protein
VGKVVVVDEQQVTPLGKEIFFTLKRQKSTGLDVDNYTR